jgi:hypothetical protein
MASDVGALAHFTHLEFVDYIMRIDTRVTKWILTEVQHTFEGNLATLSGKTNMNFKPMVCPAPVNLVEMSARMYSMGCSTREVGKSANRIPSGLIFPKTCQTLTENGIFFISLEPARKKCGT